MIEKPWKRILIFGIVILTGCRPQPEEPHPRNVLFIAIDDLRPQLGCYNLPYMHTPNLDRLAAGGFVFDRHYVQVPTCGASRYSLLTGRRPATPDHLSNDVFARLTAGKPEGELPENFIHLLRNKGFRTAAVGKITHAPDGRVYGYEDDPSEVEELPHSWDLQPRVYGRWGTGWNAFFGYADGSNRQSRHKEVPPYEMSPGPDTIYPDGMITREALSLLDTLQNSGHPFFLAVGYYKPHLPWTVPQKYWDLYAGDSLPPIPVQDIPGGADPSSLHASGEFNQYLAVQEHPDLQHPASAAYANDLRRAYAACVSYIDAQIGLLMQALDDRHLTDQTMIVIWGDHGWHLGDQRVWGKHTLSEYALRSALILNLPGDTLRARHMAQPVETIDVFPTILEVLGQGKPDFAEGKSLLANLKGEPDDPSAAAFSFWQRGISMRTNRYRLTQYLDHGKIYTELFDYQQDPDESQNLAATSAGIVQELMPRLQAQMPEYLRALFDQPGQPK